MPLCGRLGVLGVRARVRARILGVDWVLVRRRELEELRAEISRLRWVAETARCRARALAHEIGDAIDHVRGDSPS